MKRYFREIVFSLIGILAAIITYLILINFLNINKPEELQPVTVLITSTPIPTISPTVTKASEPTPSQIDYDSIPGVTEGQTYPDSIVAAGSKNLLIIGEDKIAGLYDTIGIVSLDKDNQKLKLIMIPRDMYINYNKKVIHYLEKAGRAKNPAFYKINAAYNIGIKMNYSGKFSATSINFLADILKEIFNVEIVDYIKVNTEGFKQLVDLFGGVNVNVPYVMNYDDPFQGLSIHLKKGLQHLDGNQAEGFVRFRQGYDENNVFRSIGDIERKRNQITFIKSFLDQKLSVGNITKIPGLIKTLNKNMKTSIGAGDILINYMGTLKDFALGKYIIDSTTITGRNTTISGSYFYIIGDIKEITY